MMLKRPLQIWLVFGLALLLVVPAMVLVTIHALDLDRARNELLTQTKEKSRQAQLQDLVTATLWRMDSTLTPLIGPETTRPYVLYQPFLPTSDGSGKQPQRTSPLIPSPLLENPSQFVVIHFQVDDSNRWSSPQTPSGEQCTLAMSCGVPASRLAISSKRLVELQRELDFQSLVRRLPQETLRRYVAADELLAMQSLGSLNVENSLEQRQTRSPNTADFENTTLNRLRGYPLEMSADSNSQQVASDGRDQGDEATQLREATQNEVAQRDVSSNPNEEALSESHSSLQQSSADRESPNQSISPDNPSQQQAESPIPLLSRGGKDWVQRHQAYQSYSESIRNQQTLSVNNALGSQGVVEECIARWTWLNGKLIIARRVVVDGKSFIQGCWIDWPLLKAELLESVSDLISGVDLQPIMTGSDIDPSMSLATIPVSLVITNPDTVLAESKQPLTIESSERGSPIAVTLTAAWICFLLATTAVGLLLMGVIQLSERRGAFVSAVTHELRTPLTTFRMYAEMLARGMVRDEEKKQEYLATLQIEADRLTHLVENVLAYSRLERGRPQRRREKATIEDLLGRMDGRFQDRATQANMSFVVELDDEWRDVVVETDPAALEQILFNLVENACKYARNAKDNRIRLTVSVSRHWWRLELRDYGPGIHGVERRRLFEPFSKSVERAAETAPGVGLGLALCRRLASDLGGRLLLVDMTDELGACFRLELPRAVV